MRPDPDIALDASLEALATGWVAEHRRPVSEAKEPEPCSFRGGTPDSRGWGLTRAERPGHLVERGTRPGLACPVSQHCQPDPVTPE